MQIRLGQKMARNAYAVCRAQQKKSGKKWSNGKYERCVKDVKRKIGSRK
jgi:uncharacterized protein (UPF0128 family)